MNMVKVNIYTIVGDPICASPKDGDKVYKELKKALIQEKQIVVSFLNVEILTVAFLNTAIGKLYGEFDGERIKNSLSISDISDENKLRIKRVVDTAKAYYKDPDQFEKSINKIMKIE